MPMPELTIRAGTLVLAVGTKVPLTYLSGWLTAQTKSPVLDLEQNSDII